MELLREKLKIGKCLLLLDALDEVPTEHRKRLVEKLNRFAQRKSPCPIICTSRIVGYGGAFVAGVKEVEIVPFTQKQTEKYIEKWFDNAEGYLNNDAVSAASLIQELRNKPQIRGLAQNPLLLSLICSLYQEQGLTLPARRCQVYEQAVRYMLGKWSKNRNPELTDAWIDAKTELLEELAYQFSCDGKEIFTLRELRKKIDEYLRSGNASTDFDNLSASHLISELSEQDGILQKLHKDGDQYLFLHRTFQEYLTACYLNRSSGSLALVREHFWEYEWHETLTLLAGLMENPVPFLQAITAEKDDIFSTLLLLAGRCIAECQDNSHPLIAEIIDRIYKFWQSYPNAGFIKSIVVAIGSANSQMLKLLQKALEDEDYLLRWRSAGTLGEISSLQAMLVLIAALNHQDKSVRGEAIGALAEIGSPPAIKALITALNHKDSIARIEVAEALGRMGNPEAVEVLIAALNDKDSNIRSEAAGALGEIGSLQAIEPLIAALNDKDSNVRSIAASALGEIGSLQAIEPLIAALNDKNSNVRSSTASALGEIGSLQAIEPLIAALNDKNSNVRLLAADALGRISNPQAVEALVTALNHEDSKVRWKAAEALSEIGSFQAIEALRARLNDEDSLVRWQAAGALARMGNPQAVEVLIALLNDENSMVRWLAAEALGWMGNPQAVQVLIAVLNDKDNYIRAQAAKALSGIGTSETLEKLLQLPEIDIYQADIFTLARMLVIRFSKERRPFIPVYPQLVAHKQ